VKSERGRTAFGRSYQRLRPSAKAVLYWGTPEEERPSAVLISTCGHRPRLCFIGELRRKNGLRPFLSALAAIGQGCALLGNSGGRTAFGRSYQRLWPSAKAVLYWGTPEEERPSAVLISTCGPRKGGAQRAVSRETKIHKMLLTLAVCIGIMKSRTAKCRKTTSLVG